MSDDPQSAAGIREALAQLNAAENDLGRLGVDGVIQGIDAVMAQNAEGSSNGQPAHSRAEEREGERALFAAFPDYHRTIHTIVAEPPFAAFRWTMTGTQRGDFRGQSATGETVRVPGMSMGEFENGLLRRWWVCTGPGIPASASGSTEPVAPTLPTATDPQSAAAIRAALMRGNRAENDLVNIGVDGVLSVWDEVLAPNCEGGPNGQVFTRDKCGKGTGQCTPGHRRTTTVRSTISSSSRRLQRFDGQ